MTNAVHQFVHDKDGVIHLKEETVVFAHFDVDRLLLFRLFAHENVQHLNVTQIHHKLNSVRVAVCPVSLFCVFDAGSEHV